MYTKRLTFQNYVHVTMKSLKKTDGKKIWFYHNCIDYYKGGKIK